MGDSRSSTYSALQAKDEQCSCLTTVVANDEAPMKVLSTLRQVCIVLRNLYLPSEIWEAYQNWHESPTDNKLAAHRSKLLLALERGHISRLTLPVHRFLVEEGEVKATLQNGYRKDLSERWVLKGTYKERHRLSKIHDGKVAELQVASWLDSEAGYRVVGLEALGADADIIALSGSQMRTALEVKAIGVNDADFELAVYSMEHGPTGDTYSAYDGINYLLYRVYEAASQLLRADGRRIAVVVAQDQGWHHFAIQLGEGWIDWRDARFVDGGTQRWTDFIGGQMEKDPDLLRNLAPTIGELDEIWILKQTGYYELERPHLFRLDS